MANLVRVDNRCAESDIAGTLSVAALCARTNCALLIPALRSLSVVSVRVVKLAVLPSVCNLHELSVEQRLCQINQVPLEFTSTHSELGQ